MTNIKQLSALKNETPINYRFLNMDSKEFEKDQVALITNVGKGGLHRAIPNLKNNQVLIAASKHDFGEVDAIQLCRELTGLDRFGNIKDTPK